MNFLKKLNRNRWDLAFFKESDLPEVLNGQFKNVHFMSYNDKTRWFADPFILSVNDNYLEVLVEELTYASNKGRIAKLTVSRKTWELQDMKIILELDTHLSFPMIFRRNKEIIVIPENSASGKSTAYLYNEATNTLDKISTVCNEPLTDATILLDSEKLYLLSTQMPDCNGYELGVFKFDINTLKAEKIYTISFPKPVARNAGAPIKFKGQLYRPAQDCDGDYGRGVILQKINYDSNSEEMTFTDYKSIYPFTFRYQCGLHTLNIYDGMCVIDARGYLHPVIGRIVRPIINAIKRRLK